MTFPFQTFAKITALPSLWLFFRRRVSHAGDESRRRYKYVQGGTIIMCNHRSGFDPIFVAALFARREIRFWAGEALYRRSRLFSWLLDSLGFIRVDRGAADMGAFSEAVKTLERGGLMGVFPEGRFEPEPGVLLPFKPGCAMLSLATGAPVLPVYLYGRYGRQRARALIGEKLFLSELPDASLPRDEALKKLSLCLEAEMRKLQALAQKTDLC